MAVLFDIHKFNRLYRRTKTGAGVSGATVYLKLNPLPAKRLRLLTHVTVENRSNPFTKCRIGIDHGGLICYLDELQTVAADELCVGRSDYILGELDRFFAELIGTTDDDELVMTCIGWEQSL